MRRAQLYAGRASPPASSRIPQPAPVIMCGRDGAPRELYRANQCKSIGSVTALIVIDHGAKRLQEMGWRKGRIGASKMGSPAAASMGSPR